MLRIVESHEKEQYAELLDQMHVMRAIVFRDRLKWDVTVVNEREIDEFDLADPLYILSVDEETGDLAGAVRLLPTTGPNMLRDVFSVLLPEGRMIESPLIWESSRFCTNPDFERRGNQFIKTVTSELLCGLAEVGLMVGLTDIVSVYDARMARIFRAAACPAKVVGNPTRIGRVMTYAGLFDMTEERLERIAAAAGIAPRQLFGWQPEVTIAA